MECNRDEALRSLCIAEQKFLQHDLMCAKKFALKAQCLFPDLEGLPQLLAVLDVHIVAQQKVDGMEVNWYRILQTDASADEATIRKQYRKLALILHPDKNKSIGAEGAFKLIAEAWRVLSDKDKKAAHDARRSYTAFDYPAAKPTKGVRNFTHFSACFQQPRHAESSNKSFWTGCPSCKMQYEYMRVHENKKIPCPTCGKVFRATDIEATDSRTKAQPSQKSSQVAGSSCFEKQTERVRRSPLHMGSGFSFHWGNYMHNAAKHTANTNATADMVQQIYDTVRKERVKAQREAQEKAAMARMEAEREAWRRERMNRKLRRKEEQETQVSAHPDGSLENVVAQVTRCPVESWEVDSVSFMPAKGVENGATDASSLNSGSHQKKEVGSRIGEKAARMDHMPEPFGCRIRNNFDSTSSYDSGDAFSFSKRLKVDV